MLAGSIFMVGAFAWRALACSTQDNPSDPTLQQDAALEADAADRDASSTPDATTAPSYAKLIGDDSIWSEVPTPAGGGGPTLHQARTTPDPFPRRTWEGCGAGCRASAAGLPFDARLFVDPSGVVAGDFIDGDAYLLLGFGSNEVPARLTRIERLSDGATIAAVVARGEKQAGQLAYRGGAAPLSIALGATGGRIRMAHVFVDGRIDWQPGWRADLPLIATERVGLESGVGVATYGGMLLFPTAATETPLEIAPGSALAHARGSQLYYGYAQNTVQGFTYAGGATPIVTLAGGRLVVGVRTSADRLVWVDGLRPVEPLFTDMRVHWSPLPKSAADVVVNDGPAFPIDARGAINDMHVAGTWIIADALFGPDDSKIYELVAINTATGAVFHVPNKPGRIYMRALALTPTEMVIGYKNTANSFQAIDELVRIELDSLPAVVERWAAGTP